MTEQKTIANEGCAKKLNKKHNRTTSSAAMDALVIASLKSAAMPTRTITEMSDDMPPLILSLRSHDTNAIMTKNIAEMIRFYIPQRYKIFSTWKLLYSLEQHGTSLGTLFSCMKGYEGPCVMIIKDIDEQLFGAYLSDPFIPTSHYYGTGECFLWNTNSKGDAEKESVHEIKCFKWTGKNDYMMLSNLNFIALGGGKGIFGLWLNSSLDQGYSDSCPTFDNECLTLEPNFRCVGLEIWGLEM
ncbi:TLD-domain-containing protein [Mycotypha africana]|uniref:TLD-domain-containing protein n=1 Tax=Mycotypha africana TaxID=64632 RepID=UPI0022FFD853|nr:TLD-domain-containing protein [Mycotypha africana]KAI8971925.1 TLD-domain-containing protein [Mycotypha africana]